MTYFLWFFILQLRLRPMAKGRSFTGLNIRLRPKVKIAPTVQHCTSIAVIQFLNTHALMLSIFETRLYFLREGRGIRSSQSILTKALMCHPSLLLHHADNQRTIWAPISIIHRENHFLIASIRSIIHSVARSLTVTW